MSRNTKIKIVLVTPILQHYRLTFYEKLSKADQEYDLNVFFGYKLTEDGRPSFSGKTAFKSRGFREYKYRLPFEIVYCRGMFRAVKKLNPDVVIVQGIAGNISLRMTLSWAKRKKKKIIIWACAWEPGRVGGVLLKLKGILVSHFFKKADRYLTYSTYATNYVKNMGINASLITTCYNGIETDDMEVNADLVHFRAKEIRTAFKLEQNVVFLYVGALIDEKRPLLMLDSFAELRKSYSNITLLIIGDGPQRTAVEEKLALLNDKNIRYLGRIVDGVDPYFAASDCFVLPGVGGLALNQAMYWNKPCIVSEADGTEDDLVIEGHSGYRFRKDDKESLKKAMERRILEREETLQVISANAHRIIAEKSNVNNMVEQFDQVIRKVCSDSK